MAKYTCLKDLEGTRLEQCDTVIFNVGGEKMTYRVDDTFLRISDGFGGNDKIFNVLGITTDKKEYVEKIYGYFDGGDWPFFREYKDVTNLVIELYKKIEMEPTIHQVDSNFIKAAHAAACSEWKQKLERQFPDVFPAKYKVGQRFNNSGQEYILARTDDKTVNLICLKDGNRWAENKRVENVNGITGQELQELIGNAIFVLIK